MGSKSLRDQNRVKDGIRKFKQRMAQVSEERAKNIMYKGSDLTFEELKERDDLLTYSRLQRDSIKDLKKASNRKKFER
ncbi:MAG: hypothetical protein ACFFE8_10305 [Candidatus Heimdallarchaeota archaeon]